MQRRDTTRTLQTEWDTDEHLPVVNNIEALEDVKGSKNMGINDTIPLNTGVVRVWWLVGEILSLE